MNIPPHSLTIEQAVLAALMSDCQVPDEIYAAVDELDLFSGKHRVIYRACFELHGRGENPDALTVSDHLKRTNRIDMAGGESYLAQILCNSPATSVNALVYCQRVKEFSLLRRLIQNASAVLEMAYNPEGKPLHDVLDIAETSIMAVREGMKRTGGARLIRDVAYDLVKTLDVRVNQDGHAPGLLTGFRALDDMTLGFERKRLVIIGGRPSQGKTTITMNIIENMLTNQANASKLAGKAGLFFSMEMENESIAENMVSSLGKVGNYRIRKGDLEDSDWPAVTKALTTMNNMPLYIDERGGLTLQDMRAEARRIMRQHDNGIAFIAVDYLQRMKSTESHGSRSEEVGSFSSGLKRMAQEFDCPVIALAQLNRQQAGRPNKRPTLSDLRDSGEIEQDGDLIMFIHREEVYNPTDENRGKAELIIAKQRKGQLGTVYLDADLHFCRFKDPAYDGARS